MQSFRPVIDTVLVPFSFGFSSSNLLGGDGGGVGGLRGVIANGNERPFRFTSKFELVTVEVAVEFIVAEYLLLFKSPHCGAMDGEETRPVVPAVITVDGVCWFNGRTVCVDGCGTGEGGTLKGIPASGE